MLVAVPRNLTEYLEDPQDARQQHAFTDSHYDTCAEFDLILVDQARD